MHGGLSVTLSTGECTIVGSLLKSKLAIGSAVAVLAAALTFALVVVICTAGVASSATAVIGMINPAPNVDTAVRQAANRVTLLTEFPSLGPCFFAIL